MLNQIILETQSFAEPERVQLYEKFMQVRPGGYGEGDTFWGIRNPNLRKLAKKYKTVSIDQVFELLTNKVHEIRLLALFILEIKYASKITSQEDKSKITKLYINNLKYVNNWDLVDSSAHKLLGPYVYHENEPAILIGLAKSDNLWENRVAIIATFYHIRQGEFTLAFEIATILLNHKHDIIHKAVGWMLREIGNRNQQVELEFLKKHYKKMPRTMLRYAIEKFDEDLRISILKGSF